MNTTNPVSTVLETVSHDRLYGSSILHVARNFWMVQDGVRILDLADELQRRPEISVVAVVAEDRRASGIVSRDHLFAMLGKPFGREILNKRPVLDLMDTVQGFNAHENLFTVAREIQDAENPDENRYFLLADETGTFQGVFSAQDLTSYLSQITQEDIALAGSLQERLVKERDLIASPDWRLDAWSHYAKGVGGDFYFTKKISEHRYFFTLCDVSGKGVAASIISSMIWGMLRMYDFRHGLKNLIQIMNESIITTFQLEKYLTGMFMIWDEVEKRIVCADMGHSHALVFRGGRAIRPRGAKTNLPVGIEEGVVPNLVAWKLRAGDRLMIYSDGITEQENGNGEEYGDGRLIKAARACIRSGESLTDFIPEDIARFRGGTPQQDDMSFIMLSVVSEP
jgi:phosphoserine phosphatase RsbU/P